MTAMQENDRSTATEQQLSYQRKLFSLFAPIPDNQTIAMDAIERIPKEHSLDSEWMKYNFSTIVEYCMMQAREAYLGYTQSLRRRPKSDLFSLISNGCDPAALSAGKSDQVNELYELYELDQFYVARIIEQQYRPGIVFELVLQELFYRMKYPFTFQPRIDGKPDFVFPSVDYYRENAPDAIIFTAKRSLRERWRQIVTEGARGLGFYLATIDEDVTQAALGEMKSSRIHLVVPDRQKSEITRYADGLNVISFEDFFLDHLDPKIAKWRRNGVIP